MLQTVILQPFYNLFIFILHVVYKLLQATRISLKIKMIPFAFQKMAFQVPICRLLERKRRPFAR